MKLFPIRGGVHPKDRKELSAEQPIEVLPMPDLLHIPLQQHIGVPAEPVVERGDAVKKGQVLAISNGAVSAPIHAPTSGTILGIGGYPAPHPSGLPVRAITLKPDGEDEWGNLADPIENPFEAEPETIAERVAECGIVGMGGATFPSAIKLNLRDKYDLETLVINGAECEPYLTCDDRLMQERAEQVVDGVRLMRHALGVKTAIIAIENNKPKALVEMKQAALEMDDIRVVGVPTRYPMGSERHLVQSLTGKETPAQGLTADLGVVVHNVATAFAVHEAVRLGRPLVSRVVTVSGGAIRTPKNLEVLMGTTVSTLLEQCEGFEIEPTRLLLGGPMMGQPLPHTEVPVVKGSNAVLGLTKKESKAKQESPCIRCGTCVSVCPCGLVPLEMAARIRKEELDAAVKIGLKDCFSCGSCAYVCPSHIPLVQYFSYAKGRLQAQEFERRQQEVTKRLAENRTVRLEKQLRKKKEMLAKRKAEQEAKKKAAEAAKAKEAAEAPEEAKETEQASA